MEFLSKFFSVIATKATRTLRPKYGRMYGFEEATPPRLPRIRKHAAAARVIAL